MEPSPNSSLPYSDSFLDPEQDLSFHTPSHAPPASNPSNPTPLFHLPFKSPSATPTLPISFNPDDFLVSSPPAATPDLKRRLFVDLPNRTHLPFPPLDDHPPPTPSVPPTPTSLPPTFIPIPSPLHTPALLTPHLSKTKCNCKASRCLKLYCPCFAASSGCSGTCTCKNCQNTPHAHLLVTEARQTVLARDPRAFDPKVRNTPATTDIHTKGCNCRKGCSKNYCVCRELRVPCGPRCTCSGPNGCMNGKNDCHPTPLLGLSEKLLHSDLKFSRLKSSAKRKIPRPTSSLPFNHNLSPPFPSLNIDVSPSVALASIDDFRQVMNHDTFITPFASLRKQPSELDPLSQRKEKIEPIEISQPIQIVDSLTVKRKISLDHLEPTTDPLQAQPTIPDQVNVSKRIRLQPLHTDEINSQPDDKTPEQNDRLPDVKFVSSPTTVGKNSMLRTATQNMFGREDNIEVCHVPRILRVKMGSGQPLRKLNM